MRLRRPRSDEGQVAGCRARVVCNKPAVGQIPSPHPSALAREHPIACPPLAVGKPSKRIEELRLSRPMPFCHHFPVARGKPARSNRDDPVCATG